MKLFRTIVTIVSLCALAACSGGMNGAAGSSGFLPATTTMLSSERQRKDGIGGGPMMFSMRMAPASQPAPQPTPSPSQ